MLNLFLKRLSDSPRTIFSKTPFPYSIFGAKYSSSFPSHLTYSRHDSRNVRVSVWWDLDNFTIPPAVNPFGVAKTITSAIKSSGIKGPIRIKAFGDILRLASTDQDALLSTAIELNDIPLEGKSIVHKSLNRELSYWVSQNPPPAHIFLITVDGGSASILHQLRMKNYNILLASEESAPAILSTAASIMWYWDALVRGENLTGRYLNDPPWYGPLEDPSTSIQADSKVPLD